MGSLCFVLFYRVVVVFGVLVVHARVTETSLCVCVYAGVGR